MSTMNISLPDQMKAWVESRTEHGRFANSSDYMRDLIRRDQARQLAVATLQAAIDDGMSSGPAEVFDPEAFLRARRR